MARFDTDRSGVVPSRVPTFAEFLAEKIRTGQFNPAMPDPSGGGGGVFANDINGQLGPVVTGPPLAPAPQVAPPPFSSQPLPNPGSPMFQLGGSSDQLLTVPSGGYSQLPINPNIVSDFRSAPPMPVPSLPDPQLPSAGTGSPVVTPEPVNPYIDIDKAEADLQVARDWYMADGGPESEAAFKSAQKTYDDAVAAHSGESNIPNVAGQAITYGKEKVYEAQAKMLYDTVTYWREQGLSDREIASKIKSGANPFMINFPVSGSDSDETVTAFFDGFIDAYEHGYTAYKEEITQVPVLGGVPTKVPVEAWGPGPMAAHEYMAGKSNFLEKAAGEMFLDPANFIGLERGATEGVVQLGIRLSEKEGASFAVREIAGPILQVVGGTAKVPSFLMNEVPEAVIGGTVKGGVTLAKNVPILGGIIEKGSTQWKGSTARKTAYQLIDAIRSSTSVADDIGGSVTGPPPPATVDALGNPIPPDGGAGPVFADAAQTTLTPSDMTSTGPIPREGFFSPARTPGTYETDPATGQVKFTPSGNMPEGPVFEPKPKLEPGVEGVADAGPVPDPFGDFGVAKSVRNGGYLYDVDMTTGQVTFDPAALRAELVARKEVVAEIEQRIEQAATDSLDAVPDAQVAAELEQAQQDVIDVEQIINDIESAATLPEPDANLNDVPGYVEDAPEDDDPLLLLEDNTNTIDDLTYQVDDLKEELRMADPEDKADIREQIADIKQELADAKKERKAIEKRIKDEAKQVSAKPVKPAAAQDIKIEKVEGRGHGRFRRFSDPSTGLSGEVVFYDGYNVVVVGDNMESVFHVNLTNRNDAAETIRRSGILDRATSIPEQAAAPTPEAVYDPATQFSPRAGGTRLVDTLDLTPDLQGAIDAANAEHLGLEKDIKEKIADAATGNEAYGNSLWNGPTPDGSSSIRELQLEQKLLGIRHVVEDVAPEAIRQKGFAAADSIAPSTTRAGQARNASEEEFIEDIVGKSTPAGNGVTRKKQGTGDAAKFIPNEYVITGKGNAKVYLSRNPADGTVSVKQGRKVVDGGAGLTEDQAIRLADTLVEPREASFLQENIGYVMERAVYDQGKDGATALETLQQRVGTGGLTQRMVDDIDALRAKLRWERIPPTAREQTEAWAETKKVVDDLHKPDRDKNPDNGKINKLVRNAVLDPSVDSLPQAIARVEEIATLRFGESARAYIDAAVALIKQYFDDARKLNAVDPRIRRLIGPLETPTPRPPRDMVAQPFVHSSDQRLDDASERLLDEKWNGPGGYFKGKSAREVIPEVRAVIKKQRDDVLRLIAEGADPDKLTKAERREILRAARTDPAKKGTKAKDVFLESQARESTGPETFDEILENVDSPLTPAGNRVNRKKGAGSGEYSVTGQDKASVDVTKNRHNGTFTVLKGKTAMTDQVVFRGLSESDAIAKADELLPALQKKVKRDSWYNVPNASLTPDEKVAWYLREWAPIGDIINTPLDELVASKVGYERALNIDPSIHNNRGLAADLIHLITLRLPRTLLLADPATAWTYTQRNVMSNAMLATLNDPLWIFKGDAWRAMTQTYSDKTLDNSAVAEMVAKVRGGKIAEELRVTIDKSEFDVGVGGTAVSRAMDNRLGPTRQVLSAPFDWKREIDRRIERAMKIGTFAPEFRSRLNEAMVTLSQEMSSYAERRGINLTESEVLDTLWAIRDKNGVFGRDGVYDAMYYHLLDGGADTVTARNFAETASRRWTNLGKEAERTAIHRTNQVFPSALDETNFDHYMRYIALFHFWPTRSTKYVIEQMIKHPQYALTWYKAHEGMERIAEENGYPDTMRGFFRTIQGPYGYVLYSNPAALFLVTALMPEQQKYGGRENETWLGMALRTIKETTGLAPLPIIDAMLSLAGVYGDANVPDILPSRTTDLVLGALDAILVASGHSPHTPLWDQTMENAREFLTRLLPGVNAIPAGDKGGYIQDPIGQMVLKQNPELWARMVVTEEYVKADGTTDTRPTEDAALAYAEFTRIMENEDSDEYDAAEKAVAYTNAMMQGIKAVWPLSPRAVDEDRAFTIQLKNQGSDAIAAGETPTGPEQDAIFTRGVVVNSDAANQLGSERAKVNAYGTTRQVSLADGYNLIAYGEIKPGEWINTGKAIYYYPDVVRMSEDERRQLADEWLVSNNGLEDYAAYTEGKKALTDTLPNASAYKEWSKDFRNDNDTINTGYRDRYRELSPGYDAYLNQLPDDIKNDPAKFDQASISGDAFLAASGQSTSVYDKPFGDASDISAFRPDEIMGGGSESSGSSSSSGDKYESATNRLEKLNKSIAKYDAEMAAFDKKVMEITGGVAFDDLAPQWQASLSRRLEREGIKTPSKPGTVKNYEEWRDLQEKNGLPSDKLTYIEWTIDQASALADEVAA